VAAQLHHPPGSTGTDRRDAAERTAHLVLKTNTAWAGSCVTFPRPTA